LEKIRVLLEEFFGEQVGVNFTWDGHSSWEIGDIDFYVVNSVKQFNKAISGNKVLDVCAVINCIGTDNVEYQNLGKVPAGKIVNAFYLIMPNSEEVILVKEFLNKENFSFKKLLEKIINSLNQFIQNKENKNGFVFTDVEKQDIKDTAEIITEWKNINNIVPFLKKDLKIYMIV